ncbi:MAG: hypothetical protein ACI9R3_000945 [Verrucomicrobiales bacterium]|jgi:hypothetical protein
MKRIAVEVAAELGAWPASVWVYLQERHICRHGAALSVREQQIASLVGVHCPERVRVLSVSEVPFPFDWLTRRIAAMTEQSPARALGLTARYGIYIQEQARWDIELLVHELVHTAQYERSNGILGFLRLYLRDCLHNGYMNAEMEREARELSISALRRR